MINYFNFLMFALIGFGFIIVGWRLKVIMRKWNEDIEAKARKNINFCMIIISLPFIARSTYTLVRILFRTDRIVDDSIRNDDWIAPIVFLLLIIIADLIPTTSQVSSMMVIFKDDDHNFNTSICDSEYTASVRDTMNSNAALPELKDKLMSEDNLIKVTL